MVTTAQQRSSLDRLDRLRRSRAHGSAIQQEAIAELKRVVGFERWCLPLADPDSLLPVAASAEHDYLPALPRLLELEYSVDRYAAKPAVARSETPACSLRIETDGDLARSERWDQVMRPVGIGDVAAVACRDSYSCWGWLEAYRDRDDRPFSESELQLLAKVGDILGPLLGRKGTYASAGFVDSRSPGVLIFDRSLRVVSWSPGSGAWLDTLPPASLFARYGILPAVLFPTAVLARAGKARARVLAEDGRWVVVEAARMHGAADGHIVVTLRSLAPAEIFDLLSRVHGLTQREREVVRLLRSGWTRTASASACSYRRSPSRITSSECSTSSACAAGASW
ncbi:MAG: GAF domain-containing protein [Chloroflexota bacterium]|nr:GAF domain-containing protein [Chloroflexota bacterium]